MLSINTNLSSLIARQSMSSATNKLNQAIERMTTGYKINGAKDNAANYSISTNMTTKINSYMVAEDNVAMGLDMLSTANGSLDQISDKLTRLRALATQASNGTYGTQSLTAINSEANALVDEINRIYSTAEYNGRKLFSGGEVSEAQAVAYAQARAGATKKFINDVVTRDTSGMTKLSTVDETQILASGTYSISTVEELEKLATLANTGKMVDIASGDPYGTYEFVLANDIDLAGYGNWTPIGDYVHADGTVGIFTGTFDGNGYSIKNMTIKDVVLDFDTMVGGFIGLFGYSFNSEFKNLGLENIKIENTGGYTAGLVAMGSDTKIDNCYVTGCITTEQTPAYIGGLGYYIAGENTELKNSYSTVDIVLPNSDGMYYAAGLIAMFQGNMENCFYAGTIEGDWLFDEDAGVARIFGPLYLECDIDTTTITNCYTIDNWTTDENKSALENWCNSEGIDVDMFIEPNKTKEELNTTFGIDIDAVRAGSSGGLSGSNYVTLQVGINADSHSQIGLEFGFALDGIEDLRNIGLDTSVDYLTEIDNMLNTVTSKATEYGAVQNRLESALDEIAIQYDNLVSSRSTLRDADIAEVSSQYIQQQILQQASATLLATANQSPSIALQLI